MDRGRAGSRSPPIVGAVRLASAAHQKAAKTLRKLVKLEVKGVDYRRECWS